MELSVRENPDFVEIFIPKRFGYTSYSQTLEIIKEHSHKKLVFNFSHCAMIESSGLGLLLIAHEQAAQNQHTIILRGVKNDVEKTIRTTNFLSLFVIE